MRAERRMLLQPDCVANAGKNNLSTSMAMKVAPSAASHVGVPRRRPYGSNTVATAATNCRVRAWSARPVMKHIVSTAADSRTHRNGSAAP